MSKRAQVGLKGSVVAGRGAAALELEQHGRALRAATGEHFVPGSLNVILRRPIRLREISAASIDRDGRSFWKASILDVPVWIYRWRGAPLHVVEIVSSIHLRSRFGLRDGDPIAVTLNADTIQSPTALSKLVWNLFWLGRKRWYYSKEFYSDNVFRYCRFFGATQDAAIVERFSDLGVFLKELVKRIPVLGPAAVRLRKRMAKKRTVAVAVSRVPSREGESYEERSLRRIGNALSYTKTSNSPYSAAEFPAGYHTISFRGHEIVGQRSPKRRLEVIADEFRGKSVLDIGCNQGGMLFELQDRLRWGVGIDYDPRMVNAANLVRNASNMENLSFYLFDLENENLERIADFLPEKKADVCFLLSVCMWIQNWRQVIDFAAASSHSMLFETNGTEAQQLQQVRYLRAKYAVVDRLAESSEDDSTQRNRELFFLREPIDPVPIAVADASVLPDQSG